MQFHRPTQKGIALIVTLAFIVLLAGLLLAFIQVVRTDLGISKGYAGGSSARLMANSALNLVIGQLQKSTGEATEAWVSQPGLIRTYNTSGDPVRAYKLYSSGAMEVEGAFDPSTDLPPSNWSSEPNVYVDLNSPIESGKDAVYPIVDASAITSAGIIDADNDNAPDIEGFSITDMDYFTEGSGSSPNRLAMPVQWLYVLKDGSYARATAGTGNAAKLTGLDGSAVTGDNPPVARIAFWADDESAKININTASEGTPWDTPVVNTHPLGTPNNTAALTTRPANWPQNQFTEYDFAQFQPSQHEYQRYPGHPATTALSPVLFAAIAQNLGYSATSPTFAQRTEIMEKIFDISPRVTGGVQSSLGGTRRGSASLTLKTDRLYTSIDELLYSDKLVDNQRVENPLYSTEEARRKLIEQIKFFITANSRAPEVNLANKPRIVAWPVHLNTSTDYRSAFDRLIAFCGTIGRGSGAKTFYFTRENPLSKAQDWTNRNQQLFNYLNQLTSNPIPGFGGNFSSKMGVDQKQVLMQMIDYIRCLNLQDPTVTNSFTPRATQTLGVNNILSGMVLPLEPTTGLASGTKGVGRIPTVTEVALPMIYYSSNIPPISTSTQYYQLAVYPELFCPMAGYSSLAINLQIRFTALDIRVNGTPFTFPDPNHVMSVALLPMPGGGNFHGQSRLGGYMGIGSLFETSSPPVSNQIPITALPATGNLTIDSGSRIAFEIWSPHSGGTPVLLQKFDYTFGTTPSFVRPNRSTRTFANRIATAHGSNPQGAFEPTTNWNPHTAHFDSIVSLVPAGGAAEIGGDYRLVALEPASGDIGRFFGPNGNWSTGEAHSLRANSQQRYSKAGWGNLITGIPSTRYDTLGQDVNYVISPDVPRGINGVVNASGQPGDWDNGPALQADGPYFNKADEGTVQGQDSMNSQSGDIPYIGGVYGAERAAPIAATVFSPNRQMPSAVMFGSLPTGVKRDQPWQTLLFRPARPYLPGGTSHAGSVTPPDHLLLDLFWMPVVEPYAISEPFSTAGKINMNYQMAPFTYIRRDTGLRAVFSGVRMITLDPNLPAANNLGDMVRRYKRGGVGGNSTTSSGMPLTVDQAENSGSRRSIDADTTLKFFEERFASGKPFISATEICEIPLVPKGVGSPTDTVASLETKLGTFWSNHKLTGDNSLERPYAHIYPRLTTKSNTFNVHVWVQTLKKSRNTGEDQFDGKIDTITGEYRGSFMIERYLDPNIQSFDESDANAVLGPYKVRVIGSKQLSL
ncbi:MAG: Verru_Chthon cassette protein A [Blastochloris sp.]|nr:Verru_Chthon cassette protein A [Blastochloris sp.]